MMPCLGCFRLDPMTGSKSQSSLDREPSNFQATEAARAIPLRKGMSDRALNTQNVKKQLMLLPVELSEQTYGCGIPGMPQTKKYKAQDFFEFLEVIGSGNQGVVFKSYFKPDMVHLAVKFIPDYKQTKLWIMRELTVLKSCNDCKFLIKFHSDFRVGDNLYIVTELAGGGSLSNLIAPKFVLPPSLCRLYMKEVACALFYLHSHKVIHRDICPSNIVLTKTGHLRLIDFGNCKYVEDPNGEMMTECGNPAYRAPEMYLDRPCTFAIDWWSAGILLYRFVTGHEPFKATKLTEWYQSVTKLKIKFPEWAFEDVPTHDLNIGLLEKNPKFRLGAVNEETKIKSHPFFHKVDWDEEENVGTVVDYDILRFGLSAHQVVFTRMKKILQVTEHESLVDLTSIIQKSESPMLGGYDARSAIKRLLPL